jgi:predicted transcriptional regulator
MILHEMGIKAVSNQIEDASNFFEVLLAAEHLSSKYGEPAWVNVAEGPYLGASALTTFASVHGLDLVSSKEDGNETLMVHLSLLHELLEAGTKFKALLGNIKSNDVSSMERICSDLKISRSTASRQLKELRRLDLISISGSGKGRSPFIISMTAWGRIFCQYSGID